MNNENKDLGQLSQDLLKRKLDNLTIGREKNHQIRRERETIIENNILDIINAFTAHHEGILVKELAKLVNLNRRSVTHYIQSLRNKGKIKTSKKTGRLVSTSDVFKDPIINAEVFGYIFETRLLNKNNKNFVSDVSESIFFGKTNREYNLKTHEYDEWTDAVEANPPQNHLYEPKFSDKDFVEKMLFEYSNRVGSFIIYLIMYAINPDNYNKDNSNNLWSLSDKDKDEMAKEIINRGILSIIPFLASSFREILDKRTGKYPHFKDMKTKLEYLTRSPKFIIDDKEYFRSLINAFTRLYPLMSYQFEKIMLEQNRYIFRDILIKQPSGIEAYKQYMKDFYERLQEHK